jgi:hypothetical protein
MLRQRATARTDFDDMIPGLRIDDVDNFALIVGIDEKILAE